ncbi:tripartite tricarboxylate transporter substrate-binding protein [Pigmentiphaga humi]|uniref:tripartite tricarboxylate transporter substrate-binding protein n=1 Tax=Pigmentiphaga humi TaxID=2478468 RepID=UPI001357477B|nr:tripartite tricarboxylate transporter substrate-binding protein [Pigmentiphaga humi]
MVKVIVPFAPGSYTENTARLVAAKLQSQTGRPIIVETRPGAGSTIGTAAVAKSDGDGHTLLFIDNSFPAAAALYKDLPFDPLRDIVQLTPVVEAPSMIYVRPDFPADTLAQLVRYARDNPDKVNYGSGGIGSSGHLAIARFAEETGIRMTHVPYGGVAAALNDLLAGRTDLGLSTAAGVAQYIKAGRLKGLAITGAQRHPQLSSIPTFAEGGYPDYDMTYLFGFMGPASMPGALTEAIHDALVRAASSEDVIEKLNVLPVYPLTLSTTQYRDRVRREYEIWRRVVQHANITPT